MVGPSSLTRPRTPAPTQTEHMMILYQTRTFTLSLRTPPPSFTNTGPSFCHYKPLQNTLMILYQHRTCTLSLQTFHQHKLNTPNHPPSFTNTEPNPAKTCDDPLPTLDLHSVTTDLPPTQTEHMMILYQHRSFSHYEHTVYQWRRGRGARNPPPLLLEVRKEAYILCAPDKLFVVYPANSFADWMFSCSVS